MKNILDIVLTMAFLTACSSPPAPAATLVATGTNTAIILITETPTETSTAIPPTETITPPTPTETITATAVPVVESLKATVTADLLSCRYGPGAEYLYLFAFRKGANIKLIGRADGNNWVLVENQPQRCWINSEFVQTQGDPENLKSMYPNPDGYKIPVSPYYGPTTVSGATRKGEEVTVSWMEVIVSPGKYEDENMFPYIVEVWRCENKEIIFETLGSRVPFISFVDQPGCLAPSHGRVYVQEKHGYGGPAEIPWPPQ